MYCSNPLLTSQQSTAIALRLAMMQIELVGLTEIAFTCGGGTHRSVGCACLLAVIFYPEAHLVFHTDRTRFAASEGQGWDEFMALPTRFS